MRVIVKHPFSRAQRRLVFAAPLYPTAAMHTRNKLLSARPAIEHYTFCGRMARDVQIHRLCHRRSTWGWLDNVINASNLL